MKKYTGKATSKPRFISYQRHAMIRLRKVIQNFVLEYLSMSSIKFIMHQKPIIALSIPARG
jgi:hypothetical protein